jgi:hypothetical protein
MPPAEKCDPNAVDQSIQLFLKLKERHQNQGQRDIFAKIAMHPKPPYEQWMTIVPESDMLGTAQANHTEAEIDKDQ